MAEPLPRTDSDEEHQGVPCANHRDRLTMVRCSDCGKPICPDCMVFSPVGAKCRECARLPKSARLSLRPERAVRAIAASLAAGTAIGFFYYFLLGSTGFLFFIFFLAVGIGYLVGEATLRAAGYYRGRETALIAAAGTVWAFLFPPLLANMVAFGVTWDVVVFSLTGRSIFNWLIMAVAGYVAFQRNA
ncbi:MAG: hypothetical protein Kow00129_10150 [Thermoleophilia bacterium]